jgi:hypothetical protein
VPAAQRRLRMRTESDHLDVVAAKWVLGIVPSEALPRLAMDALEAGLDSPSLRHEPPRLSRRLHRLRGWGAMGTSNRYSPEVRERAVRLVLEHQGEHPSQWAAIESIAVQLRRAWDEYFTE